MTNHTLRVTVYGGVASIAYDGPTTLNPGDSLAVVVHDYDVDHDGSLSRDSDGDPYVECDSTCFYVADPFAPAESITIHSFYAVEATLFTLACLDCSRPILLGQTYYVHTMDPVQARRVEENLCPSCHRARLAADPSISRSS